MLMWMAQQGCHSLWVWQMHYFKNIKYLPFTYHYNSVVCMTFIFCLNRRIASKDRTKSVFVVLCHSHLKGMWNVANVKVEFLPTSMTFKLQAVVEVHRTGTLITCMNNIVYLTLWYEDPKPNVTPYLRFLSYHAVWQWHMKFFWYINWFQYGK